MWGSKAKGKSEKRKKGKGRERVVDKEGERKRISRMVMIEEKMPYTDVCSARSLRLSNYR